MRWRNRRGVDLFHDPLVSHGDFEAGTSTGDKIVNNDNVTEGIYAGASRDFEFTVTGNGASSLDSMDFFSEYSTGAGG